MRFICAVILLTATCLVLQGLSDGAQARPADRALLRVVIHSDADLEKLRAAGVQAYARLDSADGPVFLIGAATSEAQALGTWELDVNTLDSNMGDKEYYVVYRFPRLGQRDLGPYGTVLYEDEGYAIMQMSAEDAQRVAEAGGELRTVTTDPKPMSVSFETPLAPAAVASDPLVEEMIAEVDSAIVCNYVGDLSGEWPATIGGSPYTVATRHTYSGEPIQKATQYAGEHLESLGLAVEYHQWGGSTYPSVIGELPGRGSPDSIVIVCGHLDDMPSGPVAPGADDNASGTTAVLVAADIMTQYTWHYTLRFAVWTGEEQGLLGSHYYAERCYNLGEPIVGVLNLDMIAYNTAGSSRDIDLHANQTMPQTLDLAQLFADVVSAYDLNLIPQIVPNGTGASDHASFWDYGYTAILGIEDFGDFNPRYHTTSDLLEHFDTDYYVEFVKASVATTAHLARVRSKATELPSGTTAASILLGLLLASLGLRAMTWK